MWERVQPESDPTGVAGFGKPREWKNQQGDLLLRLFLLLQCWNGPNRPAELASSIFSMAFDANRSIKRRRARFRNSGPCTSGLDPSGTVMCLQREPRNDSPRLPTRRRVC